MATETATAYKSFVGGDWVDAVEGATMEVINPATDVSPRIMAKIA